jgi:hypothetical protein
VTNGPGPSYLAAWLISRGYAEEHSGYGHVTGEELAEVLTEVFDIHWKRAEEDPTPEEIEAVSMHTEVFKLKERRVEDGPGPEVYTTSTPDITIDNKAKTITVRPTDWPVGEVITIQTGPEFGTITIRPK